MVISQQGLINFRAMGLLLVLCLTAAIGLWVGDRLTTQVQETAIATPHRPDYTMDQFTITSLDISGKPRFHLTAQSMLHYPDVSETEVTRPIVEIFEADKMPWLLQSLNGRYSEQMRELILTGNVQLERKAGRNNRAMTLKTPSMKVYPDTQTLQADEHVVVHSEGSSVEATGMIADLKQETIQLLSKVRGTYVPARR